jgi:serine/threonine protein kinase
LLGCAWISGPAGWILALGVRTVGETLGRYTLLGRLAGGGMGEVFLAQAPAALGGLSSRVALKVLRSELASDSSFVQMMIDEARISMFLHHQNIVSVLDFAEDGGDYYLAMEYVQGTTVERLLDEHTRQQRKPDLGIALYIASELCRALRYAHACVNHLGQPLNIVHRDVTPANLLISTQGEVKLTDFGIARAIGRVHETQAGVVKGKFGYLAPEATRGERLDSRADIFSAGVVLYSLACGQHPIPNASVMEAIFRFEEKRFAAPSEINPLVPKALDAVIMRALEPDPAKRHQSARELGEALQEVALSNPVLRRGVQAGAQLLSELLRELMPSIFDDPVAKSKLVSDLHLSDDRAYTRRPISRPSLPEPATLDTGESTQAGGFLDAVTAENAFGGDPTPSAPSPIGAFGEQTATDMAQLTPPAHEALVEEILIGPVDDAEAESKQRTGGFGDHTSVDAPQLREPRIAMPSMRDPSDNRTTDSVSLRATVPTASSSGGWDGETVTDRKDGGSAPMQAVASPRANGSSDIDADYGSEPTRIRKDPSSAEPPSITAGPDRLGPKGAASRTEDSKSRDDDSDFGGKTEKWSGPEPKAAPVPVWSPQPLVTKTSVSRRPVASSPVAPAIPAPVITAAPARPRPVMTSGTSVQPLVGVRIPSAPVEVPSRSRGTLLLFVALAIALGTLGGVLTYPHLLNPILKLSTDPPGATVSINGVRLDQKTPVSVDVSPDAVQRVDIELDGYQPEAREVRGLDRGQTYEMSVELVRPTPEASPPDSAPHTE